MLILATFAVGVVTNQSYHIGNLLYVMLGLFVASMAYFIFVSRREIALRKERLLEDSGIDLLPYVRYAKASISLLYLTAVLLPVTILFHTNFRTWLSVVRFEEACRILSSKSEFSLDAISSECGFSSHTQIYRVFKQQTGLSPRQWRDQTSGK